MAENATEGSDTFLSLLGFIDNICSMIQLMYEKKTESWSLPRCACQTDSPSTVPTHVRERIHYSWVGFELNAPGLSIFSQCSYKNLSRFSGCDALTCEWNFVRTFVLPFFSFQILETLKMWCEQNQPTWVRSMYPEASRLSFWVVRFSIDVLSVNTSHWGLLLFLRFMKDSWFLRSESGF